MTNAIKLLFNPPTNTTKLCSFLALCNVIRLFVYNYARITAPLSKKPRKNQLTQFGAISAGELRAVYELQNKLLLPPVHSLPYAEGRYILDTDAHNIQVGCVRLQEQPVGTTKPIGYWPRYLATSAQAYLKTQLDYLTIVDTY